MVGRRRDGELAVGPWGEALLSEIGSDMNLESELAPQYHLREVISRIGSIVFERVSSIR